MKVVEQSSKLKEIISNIKEQGKTIGFVPTMGALHDGHLSLVEEAIRQNEYTVVSVFVNPTQFNNSEDLNNYPRTLQQDIKMLEKAGCNLIFAPSVDEIYTTHDLQKPFDFDFKGLDRVMEGKFRPNHFNGVVQIVSRLFELVEPDRAYFGEKDFQQLAIIRLMTETYKYPIEIVGCPIVREKSGLAMSSRNMLLSEADRASASHIYAVLSESVQFVPTTPIEYLKESLVAAIEQKEGLKVEYFDIVDGNTLKNIDDWSQSEYIVGCITVFCGKIRLIDNICYKR